MAVGAGSIKRASKLNTEAENTKKQNAQPVETKAEEKAPAKKETVKKAEPVKKETVAKKETTSKKPAAKKSAAKKPATAKKTAAPKKVAVQTQNPVNQVYHLTEELPIHLL